MDVLRNRDQATVQTNQLDNGKFILKMKEEIEMKVTDIFGQLNSGINHGMTKTIALKNSAKTIGITALAGMVALAATFGPVSADGLGSSRSNVPYGPDFGVSSGEVIDYATKSVRSYLFYDHDLADWLPLPIQKE